MKEVLAICTECYYVFFIKDKRKSHTCPSCGERNRNLSKSEGKVFEKKYLRHLSYIRKKFQKLYPTKSKTLYKRIRIPAPILMALEAHIQKNDKFLVFFRDCVKNSPSFISWEKTHGKI
jgi:hypothetical protein